MYPIRDILRRTFQTNDAIQITKSLDISEKIDQITKPIIQFYDHFH